MADLRQPPPSRWRVVERDRKLVVIDTGTGRPAGTGDDRAVSASPWFPRQIQFDGAAELTTHPFYDDKGPRTIRLDPGSAATVGRLKLALAGLAVALVVSAIVYPWVLLLVFLLWNDTVRVRLRAVATIWLDRVAREAG